MDTEYVVQHITIVVLLFAKVNAFTAVSSIDNCEIRSTI